MHDVYTTIVYQTWEQFMSEYRKDLFKTYFEPNKYLFRGQASSKWSLVSSFDRKYGHHPYDMRRNIESSLIEQFTKYCHTIGQGVKGSDIEVKGLAQHYGVPTRLLDWSYSPFIAAYFAFRFCDSSTKDEVAIWALCKNHEIWNANYGASLAEDIPLQENEHQRNQLACFTLLNNQDHSLDEYMRSCDDKGIDVTGALIKITIPTSERNQALTELDAMNINAMRLFGGYEGCSQAANDLVKIMYGV